MLGSQFSLTCYQVSGVWCLCSRFRLDPEIITLRHRVPALSRAVYPQGSIHRLCQCKGSDLMLIFPRQQLWPLVGQQRCPAVLGGSAWGGSTAAAVAPGGFPSALGPHGQRWPWLVMASHWSRAIGLTQRKIIATGSMRPLKSPNLAVLGAQTWPYAGIR